MTANDLRSADQDVRSALSGILTCTSVDLATSVDGHNWASNAFFATLDEDPFRLTLVLESGGRTLAGVRANPNVGLKVVPGGLVDPFAQAVGTATVRADPHAREETFRAVLRKEPQIEPFLATPVEAVLIEVDWWRVTHVGGGWLPGRVLRRPEEA